MKIGIDLRPTQTPESRGRGIGFYIQHQVAQVLRQARGDEFFLFYADSCPPPPLEMLPAGNHWRPLALPLGAAPLTATEDLRQAVVLQQAIADLRLDVFHMTSLFERHHAMGQGIGGCRLVATLYDLIPLVFPAIYLADADASWQELYRQRLRLLLRAERVLAISEASKRDALARLGLSEARIAVIMAGVEERFVPSSDPVALEAIRSRFGLPEQYILSVLGYHYTKNIAGAVAAYSRLSPQIRATVPLAIVARLRPDEEQAVQAMARRHEVAGQVRCLGEVTDADLLALYQAATVFFYPSRYDGFGLPVAEALRCGVPVVTSTCSALPEVAGDAALLGDPENPAALAALLERALTDAPLRARLQEAGPRRARALTWESVAAQTLQAYRAATSGGGTVAHSMRIAFWSPLNPCKSGISDYSEHLLPYLAYHAAIDLYVDGYMPSNEALLDRLPVYAGDAHAALDRCHPYAINLFQMGNDSTFHKYMLPVLQRASGVVVLHDYSLQRFMYDMFVGRGEPQRYLDEVEYSEGPAARAHVARELEQAPLRIESFYDYPVNRRILEASRGVIVHSDWVKTQLRQRGIRQPIAVIPQGTEVLTVTPAQRRDWRLALGLEATALTIGCFGRLVPTKQIETVVRAFNRLHTVLPSARLLLVGEPDGDVAQLLRLLLTRYDLGADVRVTGHVSDTLFNQYLGATDICVNLRHPSAGEISRTLCQALGAGVPVIVSDQPQFADFPDACVWKVSVGAAAEDELTAYLFDLALNDDLRRQMGQYAQQYILAAATWPQVALRYMDFLRQVLQN